VEGGKLMYPEKGQNQNQTRSHAESNPGHIVGNQALSPLRHLCLCDIEFTCILLFLSQCNRSPYGTYSNTRNTGSELTQQPSMLTIFLCEPIAFISSISARNWLLASLSVVSRDKVTWSVLKELVNNFESSQKLGKEPLNGAKILFSGRILDFFSSLKRHQF